MSEAQALALKQELPAHLQKYVYNQPNTKQAGKLDSSDIGINMLKVVQSNSIQHKRAGWGITGTEPILPQATMFLSRDAKIITPDTPFIPLLRSVKYIKWKGKQPGEGMDFMTDDENDPRIKAINGLAFIKDPQTGDNIAPPVTKYVSFYIMIAGCDLPVLMSFKRTSMPEGRWLTQSCVMGTGGNMMPFFTLCFKFNQPKTIRDGNNDWYALSMNPNGKTPPQIIEKAEKMATMAEALNDLVTGDALEGNDAAPVVSNAATVPAQHPQQQQQVPAHNGPTITVPAQQQQPTQFAPPQQAPVQQQQAPVQQSAAQW